jgi:hypothetical protein
LAFFSGVVLTVEGPADVDLRGRDRLFCHHGKLRVRVTPGAQGFTVQTPGTEVVDLGTEFGLNLAPGGKTRVMVFEGEAAVSVVGASGQSRQSALVEVAKEVEVDPAGAGIRPVVPQPEAFIALPESPPPALDLTAAYRAAVLASQPWGYWRFQQMDGGAVPNEIADRPPLRAAAGVRLGGDPAGNRWAVFRVNDPAQSLLMEGEWTPPRNAGYAIELWVQPTQLRSDLPAQTALVSVIAATDSRDWKQQRLVSYLELAARGRQSLQEPCAVRFFDRWPAAKVRGTNVFSRRNVVPSDWRHIVGQKAVDTLELYIDGELVGTSPAAPLAAEDGDETCPCRLLIGRLKQWVVPPLYSEIRPFEGRLDELAVYDRPLSPDEIRRHAGLRRPR